MIFIIMFTTHASATPNLSFTHEFALNQPSSAFTNAVLWCSKADITDPSFPSVPRLNPRWPSARATTGPLSGLPAQVARRLHVPLQPHTSASEGGHAAWKVAFLRHFVTLVYGQRRQPSCNPVCTSTSNVPQSIALFRSCPGCYTAQKNPTTLQFI